jgi:ribose-phosphate pyrophosphokinase
VSDSLVFAGPASEELGRLVAAKLGYDLLSYNCKIFPDGESKMTIDDKVGGRSVFAVQSTYPPVDQHFFQLLLASHKLSQEGAKVTAVIPYLAYARQDKEFLPGEVVSLGVVSHLLRSVGVRRVVTVDIHSMEGLSMFSTPFFSVSAIPDLVRYAKGRLNTKNPVVIAPDFGASKRTEAFAQLFGAKLLKLNKSRDRETGAVSMADAPLEVRGCEVLIVDDIISTGATVVAAAEKVLKQGAKKAFAVCVHPLMVGDAAENMEKAGIQEVMGTNTVTGKFNQVDVSGAIASHLRTLDE